MPQSFPQPIGDVRQVVAFSEPPGPIAPTPTPWTMTGLSTEHVLLNCELLICRNDFMAHPLLDWALSMPKELRPSNTALGFPIFSGMKDQSSIFDRWLTVVPKAAWPALQKFLAGIVTVDQRFGTVFRTSMAEIEVCDQTLLSQGSWLPGSLPLVKVVVVGLDGNLCRWEVQRPLRPTDPWRVVRLPPRAETIAFANQLLQGNLAAAAQPDAPISPES